MGNCNQKTYFVVEFMTNDEILGKKKNLEMLEDPNETQFEMISLPYSHYQVSLRETIYVANKSMTVQSIIDQIINTTSPQFLNVKDFMESNVKSYFILVGGEKISDWNVEVDLLKSDFPLVEIVYTQKTNLEFYLDKI